MSLQSKQNLQKKLANAKYRDTFVASWIAQTLAFQLRVLRQRADLSQDELAAKLETSQNAISRMENPNYGKSSISTLLKIASFFKVGLIVRFAPLSEIADWTANLSSKAVDVPDFDNDTGFVSEDKEPILATAGATSHTSRVGVVSTSGVPIPDFKPCVIGIETLRGWNPARAQLTDEQAVGSIKMPPRSETIETTSRSTQTNAR